MCLKNSAASETGGDGTAPELKSTRLIVNGDDFGMSKEVNRGVVTAFREGVLTSCSLMVSGDAFEDAVNLARENGGMALGLHVVTVQGRSVLPHAEISSIVDRERRFLNDPVKAGLLYWFSMKARRQLDRELAAQFERFAATGLQPSHIDSHLHMHVHPFIFKSLLRLGSQYGVRGMRVPEDDLRLYSSFGGQRRLKPALDGLIFKILCRSMKERLRTRSFHYPERVYGFFMSGRMNWEYVLHVIDHLDPGINELYLHPASFEKNVVPAPADRQRMRELDILVSTRVSERLLERRIELTTYRALQGKA